MTITQKLSYLKDNHFSEWLKVRQETEEELSSRQSMFCLCGRLATGLHEMGCKRFKDKIVNETIKKLESLINPPKNT